MKFIKIIIKYLIWFVLSILSGMGWMRIELGKPIESTGLFSIFSWLHEYIIIWIGGFNGLISFIPFILIDICFVKRMIESKLHQNTIRILTVVILSAIVTSIHYILEFILDWI